MSEEGIEESTDTVIDEGSAIDKAIDVLSNTASGLAPQIKKNALKAFGQLCTAAIDIPVAVLEGIAAEKRAETKARIKLIDTGADQIANQMSIDPEYAHVAVKKYGQKILREQVNLDAIAENAARELALDSLEETKHEGDTSKEEIKDDWLNIFEKEARNISSDDMRLLFGKILAGEIRKPSSFSIKTIRIVSQLDHQVAELFQRCCSLCISLHAIDYVYEARVVSCVGGRDPNDLQNYGLTYGGLNTLQEHGLIISDYNSYMNIGMCYVGSNKDKVVSFKYLRRTFVLKAQGGRGYTMGFMLSGVALSKSGRELYDVVDVLQSESYMTTLLEYFKRQRIDIVEAKSVQT